MPAALKFYRGDTWAIMWKLQDANGNPINLTGATARLQVRSFDDVLMIEASTANGRLTITPADGRINMSIPFAATQIATGTYRFDLEVTHGNGVRRTYRSGHLIVLEDVSRD